MTLCHLPIFPPVSQAEVSWFCISLCSFFVSSCCIICHICITNWKKRVLHLWFMQHLGSLHCLPTRTLYMFLGFSERFLLKERWGDPLEAHWNHTVWWFRNPPANHHLLGVLENTCENWLEKKIHINWCRISSNRMMKDSSETIVLPENERMSLEKGPFWKEVSPSNHQISGDMLVFMREMSSYHHIFRPRYPRQRFKIHLNPWMYHWVVADDAPWLLANFLRSFKYFWRDHKGSRIVEALKQYQTQEKSVFFLTERFILQPTPLFFLSQTKKDNRIVHHDFVRLLDSGFFRHNTNKKRPWGDHETMARIHPTWGSHLCSLLGCSFNGLGAPWAVAFSGLSWMGWMSCCVGLYPKLSKLVMEVPGFAYPTS